MSLAAKTVTRDGHPRTVLGQEATGHPGLGVTQRALCTITIALLGHLCGQLLSKRAVLSALVLRLPGPSKTFTRRPIIKLPWAWMAPRPALPPTPWPSEAPPAQAQVPQ